MNVYQEVFPTRRHEMGRDKLLRIQCLCNYMEEAAGAHADRLGVGLERLGRDGLAWVLAKLRLELHRRPGPEELVTVHTWPVSVERLQFRRDFIAYDEAGQVLATAVTQWVIMGLASRRMERFPEEVQRLNPDNPPTAQDSGDIRIPAVREARPGPLFPVRLADIDQNQHVNNGRYVDFTLESALAAGMDDTPQRLDIVFRAEGRRGDVIACASAKEDNVTLLHSLFRQSDGQELARARTVHLA